MAEGRSLRKHEATHHSAITGGSRAVHDGAGLFSGDLHAPPHNNINDAFASWCRKYTIPVERVLPHAESDVDDGDMAVGKEHAPSLAVIMISRHSVTRLDLRVSTVPASKEAGVPEPKPS